MLEVNGESLRAARKPKKQENIAPLDRGFVAALLRKATANSEEAGMLRTLTLKEREMDAKIQQYGDLIKDHQRQRSYKESDLKEKFELLAEREKLFQEPYVSVAELGEINAN